MTAPIKRRQFDELDIKPVVETKQIHFAKTPTTGNPASLLATRNDVLAMPGTPVAAQAATGTLTITTIEAGDTVTIGSITYTFVAALTDPDVPYEVLIGAIDWDSLANLDAAINGDAGEGTLYGTGTEAHPLVNASATNGVCDIFSRVKGTYGNSIATTASLTDGDFGAATLENGIDGTAAAAGTKLYDGSYLYIALTDTHESDTSGWTKIARTAL